MENNKMVPFYKIINQCFKSYNVCIPLIQRNYKWNSKMAADLAIALWYAYKGYQNNPPKLKYTLGMITFHQESNSVMQLIDGQQRITTLLMILKYIQPSEEHFTFEFERDNGITNESFHRQTYLGKIGDLDSFSGEEKEMYPDLNRFKINFDAIRKALNNAGYSEVDAIGFKEYILNNLYLLLHISKAEPFNEFINLNKNKTRFVISDRIKANLLIDPPEKIKKEAIVKLFQDLSNVLFRESEIWSLVSKGYIEESIPKGLDEDRYKDKHYPDENRLKVLCCERHGEDEFDGDSMLNYNPEKEWAHLTYYKEILFTLKSDLNERNWKSYNAYNCLFELKDKIRFFSMLKDTYNSKLENNLLRELENLETSFDRACFIESQLADEKFNLDSIKEHRDVEKEFNKGSNSFWLYNGDSEFEIFKLIYSNYINEKYKRNVEVFL